MKLDLERLDDEDLDALLISARKAAIESWPYTGRNATVRKIEREYERRALDLPEIRLENEVP